MATYVGLLVGGIALFLVARAAVVRLPMRHRGVVLHPVEVGYLLDGPGHAVLVAGVALHDAGALHPVARREGVRLTRAQVLQRAPSGCAVDETATGATGDHPLERAVVRILRADPGRPVADKRLRADPAMTELRDHLTWLGLLVDHRMTWLVRLSALAPLLVLGLGLIGLDTVMEGGGAWFAIVAAVAATLVGMWLGVPRQRPAARRVLREAANHRRELAEALTKRLATVGFGTDNPELRAAGVDPVVVAAHGSVVLWSADPLLAAALGAVPPRLGKWGRVRGDIPLDNSPFIEYAVLANQSHGGSL